MGIECSRGEDEGRYEKILEENSKGPHIARAREGGVNSALVGKTGAEERGAVLGEDLKMLQ